MTIYLDVNGLDKERVRGQDGNMHEQTIPTVLANELGDVGLNLNPNFRTGETTPDGNPNPLWNADPYFDSAKRAAANRASIRYENEIGRDPDEQRDVTGESDVDDLGKRGGEEGNKPVDPSGPDHTKAVATANQGGVNPHAEGKPDDSTDNGGDDFDDWADKFEDDLDAMNPASPVDELFDEIRDYFGAGKKNSSPIILDLDGDGIELSSLDTNNTSFFDLDGDGFAERTGWVSSDDGILVLDDGDGRIRGTDEWFGTMDTDGFSIALQYDTNADGILSAEDTIWTSLQIWRDFNQNGISEDGELRSLNEYNILSINLNASEVNSTNAGHDVTHVSAYTYDTGSGTATRAAHDIWFNYDDGASRYAQSYTFDMRAAYMASARGYGVLADLHIVISIDNDDEDAASLLSLMTEFDQLSTADIFTSTNDILDDVRAILYRWSGADGLIGDERGDNIDARELAFLEKLMGEDFLQRGSSSNPYYWAGQDLQQAFHVALNKYYAVLVAQSSGGALFEGDWYYNISTDSFDGVTGLNLDVLGDLEAEATLSIDPETFWQNVVRMIEYSVGTGNLSSGDRAALNAAIYASNNSLNLAGILGTLEWQGTTGINVNGTSGDDTLNGGGGDDDISGGYGNDVINGGGGADIVDAGHGNDTIYGGAGADLIRGGIGNDTYLYNLGDGTDTYEERSSDTGDVISFGAGIDAGDITLVRASNSTDLIINIDTGAQTGQIVIENQFNYAGGGGSIETILFNDTTTIDLSTMNYTLNGTAGHDTLNGVRWGGGVTDTIYGGDGMDDLAGADSAFYFVRGCEGLHGRRSCPI